MVDNICASVIVTRSCMKYTRCRYVTYTFKLYTCHKLMLIIVKRVLQQCMRYVMKLRKSSGRIPVGQSDRNRSIQSQHPGEAVVRLQRRPETKWRLRRRRLSTDFQTILHTCIYIIYSMLTHVFVYYCT